MSSELTRFLFDKGVATSHTTAYNPQCNGQIERLNASLWKSICLTLKSRALPVTHWESVLLDALHSLRSLLCTTTNCTPHERLFLHARRSSNGTSIPTWLTTPGRVFLKRFDQSSKYDPLVEEVELVSCNPQYAHIVHADGRPETVSLRRLAPGEGVAVDSQLEIAPENVPDALQPAHQFDTVNTPDNSLTDGGNSVQQPYTNPDTYTNLLREQGRTHSYILRNREA
jgi:hypothetical protein